MRGTGKSHLLMAAAALGMSMSVRPREMEVIAVDEMTPGLKSGRAKRAIHRRHPTAGAVRWVAQNNGTEHNLQFTKEGNFAVGTVRLVGKRWTCRIGFMGSRIALPDQWSCERAKHSVALKLHALLDEHFKKVLAESGRKKEGA